MFGIMSFQSRENALFDMKRALQKGYFRSSFLRSLAITCGHLQVLIFYYLWLKD